MRLKLTASIVIAVIFITLAAAPLILAADPEIVPLGQAQSDPRAAYRALFNHISQGGRIGRSGPLPMMPSATPRARSMPRTA
ncbi:MAG: hypothetical protein JW953_00210 [Anaerolineae bacterium]|nr:hypothetical protein [Anaerolineae bacterium]